MSLKDFEIGSKLGKKRVIQAREHTPLFSKLKDSQINKYMP